MSGVIIPSNKHKEYADTLKTSLQCFLDNCYGITPILIKQLFEKNCQAAAVHGVDKKQRQREGRIEACEDLGNFYHPTKEYKQSFAYREYEEHVAKLRRDQYPWFLQFMA